MPVLELRGRGRAAASPGWPRSSAVPDYASAYLALLQGTDPTPVAAIDELKARTRPEDARAWTSGDRGAHSMHAVCPEVPVSYAQCPICALRFRFQSELEAHAHDDHCRPSDVTLAAAPRAPRGQGARAEVEAAAAALTCPDRPSAPAAP